MVKIGEEEIENGKHLLKNVFNIGSDLSYLSTINDCIVYSNENKEIIVVSILFTDFGTEELAEYTVLAEELYEKYNEAVYVNLIMPSSFNVTVDEFEIKSVSQFTIRVALMDEDICDIALKIIKTKLMLGELLNENDIIMLKNLPLYCDKDKRLYYRKECFKILNEIGI